MIYLYIKSDYDLRDTPYEVYVELDEERYAKRYLEFLTDGTNNYATENVENGIFLPYEKFPKIEEMSDIKEIKEIKEISEKEFEDIWRKIMDDKRN
ncbi:MAG: hypothetical protein LBV03_03285 [Fusobacteriales bacterium]|jgi:hypothetical protein|nr:hypothetical protein [Fusobacteriales bacterium]